MTKTAWTALVASLALMAGSALFLLGWQHRQELGEPGVKIIDQPIYGYDPALEGTNGLFMVGTNQVFLPPRVLDYDSRPTPVQKIVYEWLPKDTTYGQRFYRATDGFSIDNVVVLMGTDRTSIHQPQYCLTGAGWKIVSQEKTTIPMQFPVAYDLPVMKLKTMGTFLNKDGERQQVGGVYVYWFVARDELTADHLERMWWMARDLVKDGVLQRWAYITYFAICYPGQEDATYERMAKFIQAAVPKFQLAAPHSPRLARK